MQKVELAGMRVEGLGELAEVVLHRLQTGQRLVKSGRRRRDQQTSHMRCHEMEQARKQTWRKRWQRRRLRLR